jgi:hypothetical protein
VRGAFLSDPLDGVVEIIVPGRALLFRPVYETDLRHFSHYGPKIPLFGLILPAPYTELRHQNAQVPYAEAP